MTSLFSSSAPSRRIRIGSTRPLQPVHGSDLRKSHARTKLAALAALIALTFGPGVWGEAPAASPVVDPALAHRMVEVTSVVGRTEAWTDQVHRALTGPDAMPTEVLSCAITAAETARAEAAAELERLRQLEAETREAIRTGQEAEEDLKTKIEEESDRLRIARVCLDELLRQEAELRARQQDVSSRDSAFSEGVAADGRKPHEVVMIRNGRLAPVEAPYFELTQVTFRQTGARGIKIEPKQQGVPLSAALEEGGWLAKSLASADPARHFITVFVTEDSIPAYYALRNELRKRHLLHSWGTWHGGVMVAGGGSGNAETRLH